MTKKDYIKLAEAFARHRPFDGPSVRRNASDSWVMWNVLRFEVVGLLSLDNPRFDAAKFVAATENLYEG